MILKLLPLLVVAALAYSRSANSDDIDLTTAISDKEPTKGIVDNPTNEVQKCILRDGRKGECVKYYLCNMSNNTVILDTPIDTSTDGLCASYIDMCCAVADSGPASDPLPPARHLHPDRVYSERTQPSQTGQSERRGCGWRNPDGVGFLLTGLSNSETNFGEFPWACALLKMAPVNETEPDGQKVQVYVGGGSLIHPSVVLTAAHLVAKKQHLHARAGEWDTQNIKEIYPHQDRDVATIVVHQDFSSGNLVYDVALLFLTQPMDLAPNVGVACLPPLRQRTPEGTRCFATGWGKDKFGKEGRYQAILNKEEVSIVEHKRCQQQLRQTRLGEHFQLHPTFMCAGGEEEHAMCRGDGGSSLSCPIETEPGRYMQSGIVAWSIGCAMQGVPGVYADVASLRDWIDDKVVGKGLDHKVYAY